MAGLALGNAAAARFGARIASPVRLYAGIEILIAVTGLGLVFGLPYHSMLWVGRSSWFTAGR